MYKASVQAKAKEQKSPEVLQSVPILVPPKRKVQIFVAPRFRPSSDYWKFTKEYIYIDRGIQTQIRWQCYLDFVEHGLLPMMKQFGYHIFVKPIEIVHNLCKVTHAYSTNSLKTFTFPNALHAEQEDVDFYEHQLDCTVWDSFWNQWSCIFDFSDDCDFGRKVRVQMPYFIWSFVNIQLSSATLLVDEENTDSEMDQVEQQDIQHKPKQETVADDNYYATQSKFYA